MAKGSLNVVRGTSIVRVCWLLEVLRLKGLLTLERRRAGTGILTLIVVVWLAAAIFTWGIARSRRWGESPTTGCPTAGSVVYEGDVMEV